MKKIIFIVFGFILFGCASVPKETVALSETIGNDLKTLHHSHRNLLILFYGKMKEDINRFVDDVYAPFVIHYVLNDHLEKYRNGQPSLYGAIQEAGETATRSSSELALDEMTDFISAARRQIESKRSELLNPILQQETELISEINQSYETVIYGNHSVTEYLRSIQKVKETQQEALAMMGLEGADTATTATLVNLSEQISEAVEKGKEIDVKSEDAFQKLEAISEQIKEITKNN